MPAEDIVIVGAGAAGLATAIFTRRLNPSRIRPPARRRRQARREDPRQRRLAVQRHERLGDRARFLRRETNHRAARAARLARRRDGRVVRARWASRFTRKSTASCSRTRIGPATCSTRCLRETEASGAVLRAATRVTGVISAGGGFRIDTSRGPIDARHGRARDGRPVASEDGQRRRRPRDRAPARTLDRADDAVAGAARRRGRRQPAVSAAHAACRTTSCCQCGSTARSPSACRARLLWTHFGVSGPVVLDMSRHWLRARLEDREARITVSFCPDEAFEAVDTKWTALAADRPRVSLQNAARRRCCRLPLRRRSCSSWASTLGDAGAPDAGRPAPPRARARRVAARRRPAAAATTTPKRPPEA